MTDGESPAPAGPRAAAAAPASPQRTELHAKTLAVVLLAAVLSLLLLEAPWASDVTDASRSQTTAQVAELLFSGFGASFLILSLVMGAAIIGGLYLAKEDPEEKAAGSRQQGAGDGKRDGPGGGTP